jgi:hypothetical protein
LYFCYFCIYAETKFFSLFLLRQLYTADKIGKTMQQSTAFSKEIS